MATVSSPIVTLTSQTGLDPLAEGDDAEATNACRLKSLVGVEDGAANFEPVLEVVADFTAEDLLVLVGFVALGGVLIMMIKNVS